MSISSISGLNPNIQYAQLTKLKLAGVKTPEQEGSPSLATSADKKIAGPTPTVTVAPAPTGAQAGTANTVDTSSLRTAVHYLQQLQGIVGRTQGGSGSEEFGATYENFKAAFGDFLKSLQDNPENEHYQRLAARTQNIVSNVVEKFKIKSTAVAEQAPGTVKPESADLVVKESLKDIAVSAETRASGNVRAKVVNLTV